VCVQAAASRLGVASPRLRVREHGPEWSGAVRCAARAVVQGEREAGCGSGASGGEEEEGERKEGGREKKKEKEKRGKRNGKKEKEIEEKKMGGRERKKEGGRCAPTATTAAVGHAGAGHGRWGTRSGGGEEKGEREKEGARFAAAGHDASRWMGKRWDVD